MTNITNILKKIRDARVSIGKVDKDGVHGIGPSSYKFLQDETITHHVRTAFNTLGIVPTFEIKLISKESFENAKGTRMTNVVVGVDYKFYDVESGEFLSGSGIGEASDSSDKGLTKAITSAIKYIYIKTLILSTKDDIEVFDEEVDCAEVSSIHKKGKLIVKNTQTSDKKDLSDDEFSSQLFTSTLDKYLSDDISPEEILDKIKVKYILTANQEATILNLK